MQTLGARIRASQRSPYGNTPWNQPPEPPMKLGISRGREFALPDSASGIRSAKKGAGDEAISHEEKQQLFGSD